MKFIIEVEDFWLDEEEIEDALKSHILTSAVVQIKASIQEQIDKTITAKVTETVKKSLDSMIDVRLTELVETGTMMYNKQEISINQYLKNTFETCRGWDNPKSQIEAYAKKFCAELKLQYNAAFATKVVMGMKEQGLLKPELVQMLLEEKEG